MSDHCDLFGVDDPERARGEIVGLLGMLRDGLRIATVEEPLAFAAPILAAVSDPEADRLVARAVVFALDALRRETGSGAFEGHLGALIGFCLENDPGFGEPFLQLRDRYPQLENDEFAEWLSDLVSLLFVVMELKRLGARILPPRPVPPRRPRLVRNH